MPVAQWLTAARLPLLALAAPVLLLGQLCGQLAWRLELQTVADLEYAIFEGGQASEAEAKASAQQELAASEEAEAQELEIQASEVGAAADGGGAAGSAGADAVTDSVGADAEGAAAAAAGDGAEAAAVGVEGVAALGAEAVGEAALGAAGFAAAPVAAGSALGAAALARGPQLVAAAGREWAAVAAEVEAAQSESLAAERTAEAGASEAAAASYQAGAASAEAAALGSLGAAAGSLLSAQALQLLSLAFQAPVLLLLAGGRASAALGAGCGGAAAASAGCCGGKGVAALSAEPGALSLALAAVVSDVTLVAALVSMLLPSWSGTVLLAAGWQETCFGQAAETLRRLPERLRQAQGLLGTGVGIGAAAAGGRWTVRAQAAPRNLLSLGDLLGVGRAAGGGLEAQATAMGQALESATRQASHALFVAEANTATTTVAPLTTRAPPRQPEGWHLLGSAFWSLGTLAAHWASPVLVDVAAASLAWALCELVVGWGRQRPALRCGCEGCGRPAADWLGAAARRWLMGAGLLVAAWLLSIALASELAPAASAAQQLAGGDGSPGGGCPLRAAALVLGGLCCASAAWQAQLLGRLPCGACGGRPYASVPQDSPSVSADKVAASRLCAAASGLLSAAGCCGALLLGALEAPMLATAFTGSYRSFVAVCWLLPLLPWQLIADRLLPGCLRPLEGLRRGPLLALALALAGALAFGVHRAARCCGVRGGAGTGEEAKVRDFSRLSEEELFKHLGARGLDELPDGFLPPL